MTRLDFVAMTVLIVFAAIVAAIYALKDIENTATACEAKGGVMVLTTQGKVCAKMEVLK